MLEDPQIIFQWSVGRLFNDWCHLRLIKLYLEPKGSNYISVDRFWMHMLWYLRFHCIGLVCKCKHMTDSLMEVASLCGYIRTLHMIISTVFHQSSLSKQVKLYFHFIINCLPGYCLRCDGNNLFKGKVIPVENFTLESSLIRKRMTVSGELLPEVRSALWRWLYLLTASYKPKSCIQICLISETKGKSKHRLQEKKVFCFNR